MVSAPLQALGAPFCAELVPEHVDHLALYGFCHSMLRCEVVLDSSDLPEGRPFGMYTQLLQCLGDDMDGPSSGRGLEAVVPVPLWYAVCFSVLQPMAD